MSSQYKSTKCIPVEKRGQDWSGKFSAKSFYSGILMDKIRDSKLIYIRILNGEKKLPLDPVD